MKRKTQKIFGLLLVLVLLFTSFGVNRAFAKEEGTITVNKAVDGKTYGAYRIFDLTYSLVGQDKKVSYTINNDWLDFFTSGEGKNYLTDTNSGNLNSIVINGQIKYINITDGNVAEFANKAMAVIANKTRVATALASNGEAKFTGLALGYYLIHPQGASEHTEEWNSIVSLTSTTPDGTINSKGKYPTIKKTVNKKSEDISGKVTFTVDGKVPDYSAYSKYEYIVTDTLSKGLTLDKASVKVTIGGDDVTNSVTIDTSTDHVLKVTMDMIALKKEIGKEVKVTYDAEINKDAEVGNTGNPNKVNLEYSNDPKNTDSKDKTPDVIVKVYTGKITIVKKEKGSAKTLKGAEFVLYKKNAGTNQYYKQTLDAGKVAKVEWVDNIDNATVLTTNDAGILTFEGLKAGTYYLKETKAPEGYNKLTTDTEVTLSDDDSGDKTLHMEASSDVENSTGVELPTTGGAGTLLFTLIGGGFILFAVISLIRGKLKIKER